MAAPRKPRGPSLLKRTVARRAIKIAHEAGRELQEMIVDDQNRTMRFVFGKPNSRDEKRDDDGPEDLRKLL